MSSNPQQPAAPAPGGMNAIRIVLFVALAYMVFALGYDYGYVFSAHQAKFEAIQKLVEKETSRSAEDREKNGAVSPEDVAKEVGFGSSGLTDHKHYFHEKYVFRRGLPWMTRDIDVFYKGTKEKPELYSVAHTNEEVQLVTPTAPIIPKEPEAVAEGDKKDEEEKKGDKTDEEKTGEKKDDEKKSETPADEKKDEEKKADPAPVEEKKDEEKKADPAPTEEKKDEAKADEKKPE